MNENQRLLELKMKYRIEDLIEYFNSLETWDKRKEAIDFMGTILLNCFEEKDRKIILLLMMEEMKGF